MKVINIKNRKMICLMAIMTFIGFSSCQQEELQPEITEIYSVIVSATDREIVPATYITPGMTIFIDGNSMSGISTVTFRNLDHENAAEIPVIFNPSYNSDRMISVQVPWDESAGMEFFGMTEIKITNKDGRFSVLKIEMRKPNATITKLIPEDYQAKPGQTVEIIGKWFHTGVTSVLLGELNLDFEQWSSEKVTFTMPNVAIGDSLYVYVAGDKKPAVAPRKLNPYLGKLTVLHDFDGGGWYETEWEDSNWASDADKDYVSATIKENGPYGKYKEYKNLSSGNFYGRYNYNPPLPANWITQRDPSKVSLMFDVCCGPEENVGTSFNIQLFQDWGSATHSYRYVMNHTGWKRVMIKLSDFTPATTGADPCNHNMINWVLPAGTKIVQLDNITIVEEGL